MWGEVDEIPSSRFKGMNPLAKVTKTCIVQTRHALYLLHGLDVTARYGSLASTAFRRNYARGRVVEKVLLDDVVDVSFSLAPLNDDSVRISPRSPAKRGIKSVEKTLLKPLNDDLSRDDAHSPGKRGKKSVAGVKVDRPELLQGLITPSTFDDDVPSLEPNTSVYPTVVQQAKDNMLEYSDCVVLTRVGSFYELYFDQATQYASLLNIKLASKRTNAGIVPMAGFPFFQLDRYLKILVQDLGKHVAISEEVANEPAEKVKSGGLLFHRRVERVVTPGTLIDENFLRPTEPNYLLAIHVETQSLEATKQEETSSNLQPKSVGLAWFDVSSGDFFVQSTDTRSLSSAVARIGPTEIVLDHCLQGSNDLSIAELVKQDRYACSFFDGGSVASNSYDRSGVITDSSPVAGFEGLTSSENKSAALLMQYVKTQMPGFKMNLRPPVRREPEDCMAIDKNSLRSLEIVETIRDGLFKGSLLQAVRRTSTASGARLLTQRLTFPSMSLSEIDERLDLVDELVQDPILLENAMDLLRQSSDILRLLQKFSFGRGDADDLFSLCETINIAEDVGRLLKRANAEKASGLARLYDRFRFEKPRAVADQIVEAVDEEALSLRQRTEEMDSAEAVARARDVLQAEDASAVPELGDLRKSLESKRFGRTPTRDEDRASADDIWIMRRQATPILERLHDRLTQLEQDKMELESRLRQQLNADSLSLRFTPGLGHICHIKGRDSKMNLINLENIRVVGSTKSTRSFYLPEWTRLGTSVDDAKSRIRREEQAIFQALRDLVVQNLVVLRTNAAVLDDLDIACSSATLAIEHDLKRPKLNHGANHNIYGGRHMMVELGLAESGRQFISNDCILYEKERIWLITGPNMAGKSTFLRQTALISIIAQTGMFVPADYVEIGLVDQIFSRVGSADNLSQDQSTFMVEMLETAHILRNATSRSFVIMDEVGRGTTPEDGVAVGFAVLHQLQHVIKCRTLFATHFHALADMTKDFPGLACYCTNVIDEHGGSFRYDHRLRKGVNRQSHALKVAMLADMPADVIDKAAEVLKSMNPPN